MSGHFSHACSEETLLQSLQTSPQGLSAARAAERLQADGPNQLQVTAGASPWRVLGDQLRSIVVLLLIAAGVVSLAAGDRIEALAILAVLIVNTAIGFVTEWRARQTIAALLELDVPQAVVVREGRPVQIDASTLVVGDVVELTAGQHVPADGRILSSANAQVDEAALTGESLPVDKQPGTLPVTTPLADRRNMVHKGTTMVAGTARAVVTATGMFTEVGGIGLLVASVVRDRTPLERRLDALGRRLAWMAIGAALLVGAIAFRQGQSIDVVIETALALAVAAVPEALPAVATIALAIGVHRMARRNVLIRRLPAVESLGSTTVICADKTRTLTSGEMSVWRVWADGDCGPDGSVTAPEQRALEAAVLASHGSAGTLNNSVDRALLQYARDRGIDPDVLPAALPLVSEVPFSSERRYQASIRQSPSRLVAYVKGAPVTIIGLCKFGPDDRAIDGPRLLAVNDAMAAAGLRVIAIASGPVSSAEPGSITALTFRGFAGLMDPPAAGVRDTIAALRSAGLRTVMITGDQQLTARAIGHELGVVERDGEVVDGAELIKLPAAELAVRVRHAGAFSRVSPGDKLAIVEALQANGEVVAMLGDGVNDAPALRRADVGVSMGRRGTDIAKQAASIILQDDRFNSIAAAVEEGRVVFDNIRKFAFYLFSCNAAEIFVLVVIGAAGWPLPILPLQLLWMNLITDTFPALALAMEPRDTDVMSRPPRDPREAILSRQFLIDIAWHAGIMTTTTIAAFVWIHGTDPLRAPTAAFMTLALCQSLHLVNARSAQRISGGRHLSNPFAVAGVLLAVVLQLSTAVVPALAAALHVVPLTREQWIGVAVASVVPAIAGQALKPRPRTEGA